MEKKEFKIKNKWESITLGEYLEITSILQAKETKLFSKENEILKILTGEREFNFTSLGINDFNRLVAEASFLSTEIPTEGVKLEYNINGKKFKACVKDDLITTAQFIDLNTLLQKELNISDIISILLVPKGHEYNDGYDMVEHKNYLENNMKIIDVNAISFFFLFLAQIQLNNTNLYLEQQMKEIENLNLTEIQKKNIQMKYQRMKDSIKDGAGLYSLIKWWNSQN